MSDAAKPPRNLRPWFALGAVIAAVVAGVFGFIGDGVESEASGFAGWIITYAHTLVWVLLALALTVAAIHKKWSRAAGTIAVAAAVVYGIFLVTLFTNG